MQRTLKQLAGASSKRTYTPPVRKQIETAQEHVASLLQQARNLGISHARRQVGETTAQTQEGIKDVAKSLVQKASDIVGSFLDSLRAWFADHADDDEEEPDGEAFVENLSDAAAQYEIVSAMEQGVLDTFTDAGVPQITWIANPDACERCKANAAQGAIDIGSVFESKDSRPPAHARCKCHLSMPD